MEITKPATGSFCWIEHSSNDLSGAKKFYADVFGWTWADQKPRPDGSAISLAQRGKPSVGALSAMSETARSRGVKPHWLSYVFVDDVDASAARAQKLRGELLLAPSPV